MKFRQSIIAECRCFSASCLRAGSIRLALALVLALLVVPGYVVAPVLFANLDTSAQAGHLAGLIFHIANRAILLLLIAVALFWRGREAGRWRWILLTALLLLCGTQEFVLAPHMQAMKDAMGPIDALPKDSPQRAAFGMWHGISALLHLAASLFAAGLTALGWSGQRETCQD
ncbi:MAG: DUF4149 domain-containing protein [Zetaproteobacteria bacterium CG12_big_fil_rev_8_21_14_0_65_55_1124]|nr:MAG: hypothetical protein AUJ58_11415 [Zetaproteobacteria bacterium CG1_02_55_237]PIS18544.1 MAG: DUF4149 domain-containing protein [Zetaproteobacteria bacterium CG08_land_8_20_14_0_20_55_17]PIW42021.1 MAG: DUF4149 domain-containing protein [Zetaproteobacteria bacterium CG12_big_fil_rev_8_21_14_0_65_55_1124]PIY53926.1 MAG: DUF4149 domain-containing protein [Zetaproteobacteria bacterium CG_4_10_14_0_8_um_filter_55_43]PIZ39371.1 MAG: DUF4149 domain-containing protein [Zetaproteobacteria bacter